MDREFLADLFFDFGPVTIRRMFSGYGISADGVNFALSLRAGLFFRADEQTIPRFVAEGSQPFSYQTSTRSVTVATYWQLPARLFDDTEAFCEWARAALGAAQRTALKKRARQPRKAQKAQAKASAKSARKPAAKMKAAKTKAAKTRPSKTKSKEAVARTRAGKAGTTAKPARPAVKPSANSTQRKPAAKAPAKAKSR
jgi:DNA transformation protein